MFRVAGNALTAVVAFVVTTIASGCVKEGPSTSKPDSDAPVSEAVSLPNSTVVFVRRTELRAFAPDGRELWRFGLDASAPLIGHVAVARDSTLYLRDATGLRALSTEGKVRWTQPLPKPAADVAADAYSPVALSDSSAMAFVEHGKFRAFTTAGALLWELGLSAKDIPTSRPAGASDGHVYIVTGSTLYGVLPNGHVDWTFKQ